ncbi:hypothetical protein ROZALSC1DRAFT_31728, partial [Rozella allomycis CSF55]
AELKEEGNKKYLRFTEFQLFGRVYEKILVRQCWEKLFVCLTKYERGTILGASGIGKSMFLLYLAYRFMQEGQKVVFSHSLHRTTVVASKCEVVVRRATLEEEESAVFLFDSVRPTNCTRGYLVSTPRDDPCFNEFKKVHRSIFHYMPTWTADELDDYMSVCLPNATEDEIERYKARYHVYGGVPRTIFDYGSRYSLNEEAENMIYRLGITETMFHRGTLRSENCPYDFDMLVHLVVTDEDFTDYEHTIASEALADRLTEIAKRSEYYLETLGKAIQYGGESVLTGDLFQLYAICKIRSGGMNVRNEWTLTIKPSDLQAACSIKEDVGLSKRLYVLTASNYKGEDFKFEDILLIMTNRYDYGFKINAQSAQVVKTLIEQKGRDNVAIIFVVPFDYVFDSFKEQKIIKTERLEIIKNSSDLAEENLRINQEEDLKSEILDFVRGLPQFVLGIPGC